MLFLKLKQPGQLEYNLYFVNNKKLIFHINVYFDDKKKYSLLEKTNKPYLQIKQILCMFTSNPIKNVTLMKLYYRMLPMLVPNVGSQCHNEASQILLLHNLPNLPDCTLLGN